MHCYLLLLCRLHCLLCYHQSLTWYLITLVVDFCQNSNLWTIIRLSYFWDGFHFLSLPPHLSILGCLRDSCQNCHCLGVVGRMRLFALPVRLSSQIPWAMDAPSPPDYHWIPIYSMLSAVDTMSKNKTQSQIIKMISIRKYKNAAAPTISPFADII